MSISKFKPQKVSDAPGNSERLPTRRTPPFFYIHHPGDWEFCGGEWLPRVKRWSLHTGVNGIQSGKRGYLQAKTNLEADGWIVIGHDVPVCYHDEDGELVDDTGYLCSLLGRGGQVHTDVWHKPSVIGMGRTASVDWKEGYDREGFNLWRKKLLEVGIIPAANPAALSQLVRVQERRTRRHAKQAVEGNPIAQRKHDKEKERLEDMKAGTKKVTAKKKRAPRKRAAKNKTTVEAANG